MAINHNPACPNKNCMGGVITFDGQTGRKCRVCNPMPKRKHGVIVIEWEHAIKYDGEFATVEKTAIGSFVKKNGEFEAWSAMTNKYKTVKTRKLATDFVRDQMLKYMKTHMSEYVNTHDSAMKKLSNSDADEVKAMKKGNANK